MHWGSLDGLRFIRMELRGREGQVDLICAFALTALTLALTLSHFTHLPSLHPQLIFSQRTPEIVQL